MKLAGKTFNAVLLSSALAAVTPQAHAQAQDPDVRAAQTLAQLSREEKLSLLRGFLSPRMKPEDLPPNVSKGAGYVPGVPRLGIPPLAESDASLGVANMGGFMRPNDEATAMPSALAMGSTWNSELIEEAGRIMGAETRAKGFNVLLAGGVNLVREARNGRNFEYFSEDPLLSGILGGVSVRGIQSNRVLSTVKHYVLNAQETGRTFADVRMDEPAMRMSDLLAFQLAIEVGRPGSVMCSYNKVNGAWTCENPFLLNDVLRRDWRYPGFVMSDWGSVHSVSVREGLDQESGTMPGPDSFYGNKLRDALAAGTITQGDVDRSVIRILRSMYALRLGDEPLGRKPIDFAPHLEAAQRVAEQGIVLLKNQGNVLPIAGTAKRIVVIGGHADVGVPQGGGSSQVWPVGGASLSLPIPGDPAVYHRRLYMPSAPLSALKEQFPQAEVIFDDGTDHARAARAARGADIAIVFAEQFSAENYDALNLNLPDRQDALISAVAGSNSRTVVVLETGIPVVMPWLSKVPAVLQAWYSGNRGGHAIARVLSGAVNPSGRLPITFPASLAQTPNPVLPGSNLIKPKPGTDLYDLPKGDQPLTITYPEGADVGYRWYARKGFKPLFAFGHGLSYTSFATSAPKVIGNTATFTVRNTGKRPGASVPQLYLVSRNGDTTQRLVGFARVELLPGESKSVSVTMDPRLLANWKDGGWTMPEGRYAFALGESAVRLGQPTTVALPARSWREGDARR